MSSTGYDSAAPLVLALCTSTEQSSVALGRPGCAPVLAEGLAGPGGSGQVLALALRLLADSRQELAQVDAIAFDQGPGAFTGLRVGCAVAQGLGWALRRPLLPVGALAATAWSAAPGSDAAVRGPAAEFPGTVLVANDARMNEVYLGAYSVAADGAVQVLSAPRVLPPERAIIELDALAALDALDAPGAAGAPDTAEPRLTGIVRVSRPIPIAAGDGFARYPQLADWAAARCLRVAAQSRPNAAAVLALALLEHRAGVRINPSQAAPMYVRDKVALNVAEQRLARSS